MLAWTPQCHTATSRSLIWKIATIGNLFELVAPRRVWRSPRAGRLGAEGGTGDDAGTHGNGVVMEVDACGRGVMWV